MRGALEAGKDNNIANTHAARAVNLVDSRANESRYAEHTDQMSQAELHRAQEIPIGIAGEKIKSKQESQITFVNDCFLIINAVLEAVLLP